jgi:choline monooxygenase
MAVPTIPADWYTTTVSLDRDRASVLRRGWQYIGPATDVAEPGSFTTGELGNLPIVITRDDDGTLRGFANVCRHRGAIVAEGCGRRRTLQCRYHGWTYKLDGSLHRSPGMTVDEDVRLPAISVATLGPLLFAAVDPDCEPLETVLAPFLELLDGVAGVDPNRLVHRRRLEHSIAANWKVVVENFIECYHCPLVHAETLPGYGDDDYRIGQFGPLHTQHLDDQRFCFAYLFPTTQLSAYGLENAFVARAIKPLDHTSTHVALDYWFLDDCADEAADTYIDWFEHVIGEDKPLCESVQHGLSSGAIDRGYLNPDAESGLVAFQQLVCKALDEA